MKNMNWLKWPLENYHISLLIVVIFFVLGIFGMWMMPKDEFPPFTIRQGVVIAVYPGATSEEVEQQVTRPLERFLFTYPEVRRVKTTSTSQNGMAIVLVHLNDNVNDKDEVWSKIKHGLSLFKQSLPSGVAALVANDDFGNTSALLIAIESDQRSYRELHEYSDLLGDRLRRISSVANVRTYGEQKEQISLYVDRQRLQAYGIGQQMLFSHLQAQGITTLSGSISDDDQQVPIHIESTENTVEEIASLIIFSDPVTGKVARVRDIAKVVREYDTDNGFIEQDGHPCILLSLEMSPGNNIVEYGQEVESVLSRFSEEELPADVKLTRIADQPKVVGSSINDFLRDLLLSMVIIILVMMLLFPLRSADGYLEYLRKGYEPKAAAISSAKQYFMPMMLATLCISIIFFPLFITLKGAFNDALQDFPWTITINLLVSLFLAVTVIPFLEVHLIKPDKINTKGNAITQFVQRTYDHVLDFTFRHPWSTIVGGIAVILLSCLLVLSLKVRVFPYADRDQFAVEIFLPEGKGLSETSLLADSLRNVLQKDDRVKCITSFIGCSSPRFMTCYAPQMAGRNFAQFIVNTESHQATLDLLAKYQSEWSEAFPQAYVKFKRLDFLEVKELEYRFYGEDLDSLHIVAERLMEKMRQMPEVEWVHTDFQQPFPLINVELDPVATAQLGISRTTAALALSATTNDLRVGQIWEGNYEMPIVVKDDADMTFSDVSDLGISTPMALLSAGLGNANTTVPLRQIARVSPIWSENRIMHHGGERCITVTAEFANGVYAAPVERRIADIMEQDIELPQGVRSEVGGEIEYDAEALPMIFGGVAISMVIVFFFLLFNFRKYGITIICMAAMGLMIPGTLIGLALMNRTLGLTSIMGVITLIGMIMRNEILIFEHANDLLKGKDPKVMGRDAYNDTVRQAAYDAGKRRMVPIFLTTATTAVGVVPMIIAQSSFWMPVGVTIFAGGIGALILVVTMLPVTYWKVSTK